MAGCFSGVSVEIYGGMIHILSQARMATKRSNSVSFAGVYHWQIWQLVFFGKQERSYVQKDTSGCFIS